MIGMTENKRPFDVHQIREDFPILHQEANKKPLVYLDNAATTQKPRSVIDTISHYYKRDNANVHRAAHVLSDRATQQFEGAREKVRNFINAPKIENIIWTRGTTESINLVAHSYGRNTLKAGDEIIISAMEHHSNIVPWQLVCEQTGAKLKIIPINERGELDMEQYRALLSENTKIVSVVHVSNALGTVNPVKEITDLAHDAGAVCLIDGAQAVTHWHLDMQALDCDFYAFSAHKMFGPTGMGVLYGKEELLEAMPPYHGGGEMIEHVTFEKTTYNQLPFKFEAGTPHISGAIGLAAAIDYLESFDRAALKAHEDNLIRYAHERAEALEGMQLIGTAPDKAAILSFLLEGAHPSDVGMLLDQQGIAIRTGHHCTMPMMDLLKVPGTARASFSIYNTIEEVDALFQGLEKVKTFL